MSQYTVLIIIRDTPEIKGNCFLIFCEPKQVHIFFLQPYNLQKIVILHSQVSQFKMFNYCKIKIFTALSK